MPGSYRSTRIDRSKATTAIVQNDCDMLSHCIGALPSDVSNCVAANCKHDQDILDSYAQDLVFCLLDCASKCFPTYTVTSARRLVGWKDSAGLLKKTANFWYKVWEEAGCPTSGVLFQIKKSAKTRYKYEVRRLKRRQNIMLQKKIALLFVRKNKKRFWSEARRLNRSHLSSAPVVDSVSGSRDIANLFVSKSEGVLNTHSSSSHTFLHSSLQLSVTDLCISEVAMFFRR